MGLGLGLGIWWPTQTSIIPGLLKALCARATYCENKTCTTAILEEIAAVRYTPPPPPTGILLVDYPGAAAAYSLRNLIDTTTNVVRVRRSYDNTESNFTATEITDGTLVDFTNQGWFQSAINPFTTFTGNGVSGFDATDDAGFGEAFVNVENGVSGDVVNITLDTSSLTGTWTIVLVDASGTAARSNSVLLTSGSNSVTLTATGDFAFVDIFCQNPTTSISVTNFSASINVGDDGFVTTWYDQSGNGNNAVQASAIQQGKIVFNGEVNLTNGKPSIDFNGSDNRYNIPGFTFNNTGNYQSFVGKRDGQNEYLIGIAGNQYNVALWINNLYYIQSDTGGYLVSNLNDLTSDQVLITGLNNGSTQEGYKNSNLISTSFVSSGLGSSVNSLGSYGTSTNYTINGQLQEAIFWNTDQSANRTGIETNINTEYTIY